MSDSEEILPPTLYGGGGGDPFSDEGPAGARIIEVLVRYGEYVDGIQLVWEMPDGRGVFGPYHGGDSGMVGSFILAPGEVIEVISGASGDLVDSLTFQTSLGHTHGPWGGGGGRPFVEHFKAQQSPFAHTRVTRSLRGICGRSGDLLDSIGFIVDLDFTSG